jgi:hypothetical protein
MLATYALAMMYNCIIYQHYFSNMSAKVSQYFGLTK